MPPVAVQIIDSQGKVVATGDVVSEGPHFRGTIALDRMPESMRGTFEEFETAVNDQMFSLLDEIDERIAAFGLRVRFEDGPELPVEDLQMFPSARTISFRVARTAEARR